MKSYETLPLNQVPNEVFDEVLHDVANVTIGFARLDQKTRDVELLGSGTLITAGQTRAILTAQHVAKELPKEGRIGLILDSHRQTPPIDATALHVAFSDRGASDISGPD